MTNRPASPLRTKAMVKLAILSSGDSCSCRSGNASGNRLPLSHQPTHHSRPLGSERPKGAQPATATVLLCAVPAWGGSGRTTLTETPPDRSSGGNRKNLTYRVYDRHSLRSESLCSHLELFYQQQFGCHQFATGCVAMKSKAER